MQTPSNPPATSPKKWMRWVILSIAGTFMVCSCACVGAVVLSSLFPAREVTRSPRATTPTSAAADVAAAPTRAPAATRTTVAATATSAPTITTVASTATSAPTITAIASTATSAPSATAAPTAVPSPEASATPPRDVLAAQIFARLRTDFDTTPRVSTSDGAVTVSFTFSERPQLFGEAYRGINLLSYLELHAYMVTYIVLYDFPQVQSVTTALRLNNDQLYQATATRAQAYAFPPGEVDLNRAAADTLYRSAIAARMINQFTTDLISEELATSIAQPTTQDLTAELESWVAGASVTAAERQGTVATVTLDLTSTFEVFFSPEERTSRAARAYIDDQAKLNLVNAIGCLMDRFPSLATVTVRVQVGDATYAAYRATRTQFARIGREAFITAVSLEDNERILARLDAVR